MAAGGRLLWVLLVLVATAGVCLAGNANKILLTDAIRAGAVCLDGTAPAYYLKPGSGDGLRKWYIHHEGGGWCSSLRECYSRSLTGLGSSKAYPPSIDMNGGYFSSDASVNPQMYNWNMVYLKYCDGGSFSGNNATVNQYQGHPLHFRGKRVLEAMHNDLFHNRKLKEATDVVISGCSAGGLATYLHLDWWKSVLPKDAHVAGLPDSGFFLDYESPGKKYHSAMIWTFEQMACHEGVNADCVNHYKASGEEWRCFFAQYTSPFIKTPIFPLQSVYDSWQLSEDLDSHNETLVNEYGKTLAALVVKNLLTPHPNNGVFLDSCAHHCGEWGQIKISGKDQARAFQTWYEGRSPRVYFQNNPYPCQQCCHTA